MLLLIKAKERNICLELLKEKSGKKIDRLEWTDNNGLSLNLLKSIDKILKESKMELKDLSEVKVETIETGFSTKRIIEAVAGTVCFCLVRE
jgi:hypothetical protein